MNPTDPRTILIVEDNPDDLELTVRALEESRVVGKVVTARDGAEALSILLGDAATPGTKPALVPMVVLLDIKLPKIDGLEVLRRIRSDPRTSLLPVVILTSSKQDEDRLAGYRLGANSYVHKPVAFEQFVHAVRELGIYWLTLNEPPPN
jgi:two-component system response regulator